MEFSFTGIKNQSWYRSGQTKCFLIKVMYSLVLLFGLNSCNISTSDFDSFILVCGDSKVLLVDCKNSKDSIPNIVWSWDARKANDLPENYRTQKFNSIDDCKAVNYGAQILVSSSGGAVALINRKDKKVLYYAEVPNAHSIELLFREYIIAAASTADNGNRLMLFDIHQPDKVLFSDSLYSAHGVVYDDRRNCLFAIGYDVLREYKYVSDNTLRLINEWKIPGIGGHDLQMAPSGERLFITEHTGAWLFDLESQQFSKIKSFTDAENIKSINQNIFGRFVYTVPEESWWTYHVRFLNPTGTLVFPDMKVYKVRWYNYKL